jgi:hypothetical protein
MADERDIPHFNKMANESKQTAVDWLYNNLKSHFEHDGDLLEAVQFSFNQAKGIEKQQIMDSHNQGYADGYRDNGNSPIEYYQQTFTK